jgi:hypothetical protein
VPVASAPTPAAPTPASPAPAAPTPASPAPAAPTPAAPAPAGRVHVIVKDVDSASVLVDGKVVATGVREARVPNVTPGQPHQLRVEAPGRPPFERTFTVAADAEVDLEAAIAPLPAAHIPGHGGADRARRHEPSATAPTAPGPARARHRDGLVGDDIFNAPGGK